MHNEVPLTASFFLTNCKLFYKLNLLPKLEVKIPWPINIVPHSPVKNGIKKAKAPCLGTHSCPRGLGCVRSHTGMLPGRAGGETSFPCDFQKGVTSPPPKFEHGKTFPFKVTSIFNPLFSNLQYNVKQNVLEIILKEFFEGTISTRKNRSILLGIRQNETMGTCPSFFFLQDKTKDKT